MDYGLETLLARYVKTPLSQGETVDLHAMQYNSWQTPTIPTYIKVCGMILSNKSAPTNPYLTMNDIDNPINDEGIMIIRMSRHSKLHMKTT